MAYETETENVKNYYADLLILQYRNKPKARETIKLGAGIYLADGLVFELNDCLNIDTAQGNQLDLIGKILGCDRTINGLTLNIDFFSFEKTNAFGFSDKNELSQGYWKSYQNSIGSEFSLQDGDYRHLLKFKAAYNIRRGTWGDLDNLYYRFFGNEFEMVNNKDLTVTYNVQTNVSVALQAAIYLKYIEPPMGVGYTINYLEE